MYICSIIYSYAYIYIDTDVYNAVYRHIFSIDIYIYVCVCLSASRILYIRTITDIEIGNSTRANMLT